MEIQYHMEDFTEANYKIILETLLKKGYRFVEFDYAKIASDEKAVIWRHDVDLSLNRSCKLAEIEAGMGEGGVKATYFIHLHSNFYNIFESSQYELIKKIIELGHMIGLHFDHAFYAQSKLISDEKEMERYALIEKELLEKYFDINIKAVSFHNPEAANVLTLRQDYYAGMVNAYSQTIFDNCKYCSDSNGYWRYDRLQEVIERGYEKLHILTHPVWWTPEMLSPYERVRRCVDGRREAVIEAYCDLLDQCGRENVGYKS